MELEETAGGIKGFVETSFVDWRAKICSVIFLGGCNFRCPFCHNADLVLEPHKLPDLNRSTVFRKLEDLWGWVDGVCLTGGEPTLHDSLPSMIREIRELGFPVKLDTNGSRPRVLERLIRHSLLDCVSMDVKAPLRAEAYARCAGRNVDLEAIRSSMEILGGSDLEIEFRTTVVPGLHGEEEILEIARSLPPGVPYRLQAFRPGDCLEPGFRTSSPLPQDELVRIGGLVADFRPRQAALPKPLFRSRWIQRASQTD